MDVSNKDGDTPLQLAVRNGHLDIVKFLCWKGAMMNAMKNSSQKANKIGGGWQGSLCWLYLTHQTARNILLVFITMSQSKRKRPSLANGRSASQYLPLDVIRILKTFLFN